MNKVIEELKDLQAELQEDLDSFAEGFGTHDKEYCLGLRYALRMIGKRIKKLEKQNLINEITQ